MSQCASCGTTILFGGVRDGDFQFCSPACHQHGLVQLHSPLVPDDLVEAEVLRVHQGPCPQCQGGGPIDVHQQHWIWSAFVLTRWGSRARICCRSCGRKGQILSAVSSLVVGWWGFPWGLLMTPIQLSKNFAAALAWSEPEPSESLRKAVRAQLAGRSLGLDV